MRILVTGFDPFGGEKTNPAYEIVAKLPEKIEGHQIIKKEVPTVFEKSIQVLQESIRKEKPDIVLCIGQAGGEYGLRLEKVAINLNEARIKDNEGNQPLDTKIEEEGETAYFTNLPIKAMQQALEKKNIPSNISYTAGTFVCNHIFYGLMHEIKTKNPNIKGGFLHVPYLPKQVINKRNTPYMSLDMMVEGVIEILKVALREDGDISEIVTGNLH